MIGNAECSKELTFEQIHVHVLQPDLFCAIFRENRTKFNPSWEDDDTVLSYSLAINYTFDKELSTAGDPKQIKITTINVPLMVSQCPISTCGSFEPPSRLIPNLSEIMLSTIRDNQSGGEANMLANSTYSGQGLTNYASMILGIIGDFQAQA